MKVKSNGKMDYTVLICCILLVIIGLVFVYSASYYTAQKTYNNKYFFLIKQALGVAVGIICLLALTKIKMETIYKLSFPFVIVSLVLLGLVFIPGIGLSNYGANRWIGIGGFSIQPSEIAKFALVIFASVYLGTRQQKARTILGSLPVIIIGGIMCVLIILEPNMSITICVGVTLLLMLLYGGLSYKVFAVILIPCLALIPVLIFIEPYRIQRLLAFIDPWASPRAEGYQLIQSFYALGGGGLFGVGLFNSRQKLTFLPFAESDFIFSIIGEELGFVGSMFVLLIFCILIYRGIVISLKADNKVNSLIAAGITSVIAVQTAINLAVVTGCIPPTGLPLPFISYGGSSIVVFMSAVGILLNISKRSGYISPLKIK